MFEGDRLSMYLSERGCLISWLRQRGMKPLTIISVRAGRAPLSTFDMTRYVQIWKCLKVAAWSLKVAVKLQAQVCSDPTHHPSLLYPLRIFETHLHPTGLGLLAEMISLTRPSGGSHVDPTLTSISGGSKCLWSDDVGLCWPHHFDACEPLWALGSQSISMAAWREHQNGISL